MHESDFDAVIRALTDGSLTRRGLARGLAGVAAVAGLIHSGVDDLDAKKRKKGKKRKKRKRRGQDNAGSGDGGGGGNPCGGTICNGHCVDLNTDLNNCGACGAICRNGDACTGGRCVEVIGSQGSGAGQFNTPSGIAVDSVGVEYVTDTGNERLVLLAGREFGNADFAAPVGVAINTQSGDIYVTDAAAHLIARFSASGDLLGTFGSFGSGLGQFDAPLAVAIDTIRPGGGPTNQVFIADTNNNRIQRFSATGFPLAQFGRAGDGEGQFRKPAGLTISPGREVVVADTGNDRIQVLGQDGTFIRAFGSTGSGPGQFSRPVAVAVGGDNELFVVDQGNNRVQQFTTDGQFVTAFGSAGSNPGQFNGPTGIVIKDGGVIFVVDSGNHRVQMFFPGTTGLESAGSPARSGNRRAHRAAVEDRNSKDDRASRHEGKGGDRLSG